MSTNLAVAPTSGKRQRPYLLFIPAILLLIAVQLSQILQAQSDPVVYTTRHVIRYPHAGVDGTLTGDIDGDGDLDVVVSASEGDAEFYWMENLDGSGRFWAEHGVSTYRPLQLFQAHDMDNDGHLDIVTGGSQTIDWYENAEGDGSRWLRHSIDNAVDLPDSLSLADVDGDADLDLVGVALGEDTANLKDISWWENSSGDASTWVHHAVDPDFTKAHAAFPVDFDGDQDVDILGAATGRLNWWENSSGDGTTWIMHSISTFSGSGNPLRAIAADIDGDGHMDAISASGDEATLAWHENVDGLGINWATHVISDQLAATANVHAVDLDIDGDVDVLNIDGRQITWWENSSGDGSRWVQHVVEDGGEEKSSIATADLDEDGDIDILATSADGQEAFWWEANGQPVAPVDFAPLLTNQPPIDLQVTEIDEFAAADLDNDGDQDLVMNGYLRDYSPQRDHQLVWLENVDPNRFLFIAHTTSIVSPAADVFTADINGDGRVDIISLTYSRLTWHENLGGARPVFNPHVVDDTLFSGTAVFAADLNGDGHTDIVVTDQNKNTISWYQNDGMVSAGFVHHVISASRDGPVKIFAADVDGDEDVDLAAADYNDDTFAWYENDGQAVPIFTEHVITDTADGASDIYVADLDGDSDADLVTAAMNDNIIGWYESDGAQPPGYTFHVITDTLTKPRKLQVVDLNGDDELDVLISTNGNSSAIEGSVVWFAANSAPVPGFTPHALTHISDSPTAVAVDLNNSGLHHLVVGNAYSYYEIRTEVALAVNDGGAVPTFPLRPLLGKVGGAHDVHAADLDQDGDLDPIVATFYDGLSWYEHKVDPLRHFVIHPITESLRDNHAVFPADLNGDTHIDLVTAAYSHDTVAWYENDGGAPPVFTSHIISDTAESAKYVHVDDLDGDADMDVIATLKYPNTLLWFENDGGADPTFITHIISDTVVGARSLYTGDLDNDGDRDIVVAAFGLDREEVGALYWFENDGDQPPKFTPHTLVSPVQGAHGTFIADVDGDADTDVLFTSTNGSVSWLENDGAESPTFTRHYIDALLARPLYIKAADMDGDGDMDVLVSSREDSTITWYENTGAPTPGKFVRHLVTAREGAVMGIHPADVDADSDLDLFIVSVVHGKLGWWRNQGASWQIDGSDVAPETTRAGATTAVLRLDLSHNGQPGDLLHELAALSFRLEDASGQPLPATAVPGILANATLHLDDGSGVFEPGQDMAVETAVFSATGSQFDFAFTPGAPAARLAPGQMRSYFLVLAFNDAAQQQPWRDVRVTHLWEQSRARYLGYDDSPLLLPGTNTTTDPIHILSLEGWEMQLYLPLVRRP